MAVHTLRGLRVHEISLVDAPANPGALHVLFKRKEPPVADPKTKPAVKAANGPLDRLLARLGIAKRASADALDPDVYADAASATIDQASDALTVSLKSILGDAAVTDKTAAMEKSLAQFRGFLGESVTEHIEKAMRDVALAGIEKDNTAMPTPAEELIAATAANAALTKKLADAEFELLKAKMPAKHAKFMAGLSSDDAKAKFAAKSPEDRDAQVDASANDTNKRLEGDDPLAVELRKAQAQTVELEKRVAVFEAERELIEFRKRATEVGVAEAQAETILKASKGDPAAFGKVLDMIKAANAQARAGAVFKEFGHGGAAPIEGSARAEIEASAEVLRKADPKLGVIAARVQVRKANIELAQRERDEERAAIRAVS